MAYLGASPLSSFASPSKDTFSGDNSTTSFTMGQSVGDPNQLEVFVDNVRQEPTSAYTVNGTTLTFTGTPATGSNNIYVIHKQGVIGNGLLPTSGRDSDRVGSLTVDGASTLTGNITTSGNISATSGSITAGGALSGVTTLTTSSTATIGGAATIGGDTAISGNLRSDNSADGIQLDSTDGSANAGDLVLLDGTDGSATNAGSSLLYEDGTGDPANYFNNNMKFSGAVEVGGEVTANSITSPTIRKNASSPSFTLPSADGTSGQAIITDASGTLSFGDAGGGKVLQVVSTLKDDMFTTSSTSFTQVTGLSASITPSATSSKVLVIVSATGYFATNNSKVGFISVFKGGSNLIVPDTPQNRTPTFEGGYGRDDTNHSFNMSSFHFTILDSPNTTSSTTYDVRVLNVYSGNTFYINRAENNENTSARPQGVSSIILMEIGA